MNRKYRCWDCGEGFNAEADLEKHQRAMHLDHKCEVCGEVFNREGQLRAHVRNTHHAADRRPARHRDRVDAY